MNSLLCGPKADKTQKIVSNNSESECATEVYSRDVEVQCRVGTHSVGSSKVKLINRIDYPWELRYYLGQLVAAHTERDIIAYGMKGKDGGMVRVFNPVTNQRALIKNLKNDVRDVSFAFTKNEIILGCVDDDGTAMIYEIEDKPDSITCNLVLQIYHPAYESSPPSNFKMIWCPYLPCADEDFEIADDSAKMFVFLNGSKAEVWDVMSITNKHGVGPVRPDDSHEGYVEIDHELELIDAAYSSDGTAIATACLNGYVYFYQIYRVDTKQKCLHEWKPHDGQPVSCLIFIDNILEYNAESRFWKFALTGANHNQEIKLWSCENWTALQTIHFKPDPACVIPSIFLKIRVDYTGRYIVMSDINNKVLYVLKLERNDSEKVVAVTMISEFLLPAPFLSFHITEGTTKKVLDIGSDEELYHEDQDDFDEENTITQNIIKMLVIQPKKFQECNITFHAESMLFKNKESHDLCINKSDEVIENVVPKLDDLQPSVTMLIQQTTQLLTPEAFTTTSSQNSRPNSVRNSLNNTIEEAVIEKITPENNIVDNLIDFQRPQKDNFASGGSSPSREVQEILSLNNSTYSQEYFDNLTKPEDAEEPQKPYSQSENLVFQNSETVWPKIPVVKDNEIIKDSDIKEFNNASNSTSNYLTHLNYRLTSLENAIRDQTMYIQQLQTREEFSKELDVALSKQHLQIVKLLDNLVTIQKNNDREHQDQFIGTISQMLAKSLSEKIQTVVMQEMKNQLVPTVRTMMESLKHQIDVQYSQKLASTDQLLKDNISKLVNSKAVTDSLAVSVVSVIAPSLEKCYRDMITTSLIPSWEKVCNNMFQQINTTFTQGTKEYTASVESYMERQRRAQEKGKDLLVQMHAVSDGMKANSDKLTASLSAEINKQFSTVFKNMQDKLMVTVKESVSEQVKQGFKRHASVIEDSVLNAVRSRAVTPSPHIDTQTQLVHIQQALARGNYTDAFQQALTAENLNLVIYVCEKVDVQRVSEDLNLPQTCLLALLQQLSVDLINHTELKLSYIRAAFLSLSPDHPNTKQFVPKVLKDLVKQLQSFINSNPPIKHISDAKLLRMAIVSTLGKFTSN